MLRKKAAGITGLPWFLKNARTAFNPDLTEPYKKELYPDLEQLKKDEVHRFEILLSHWDVETIAVDLDKE